MQTRIFRDGKELGPYSADEVRAELAKGNLTGTDYAWQEGLTDWVPLNTLFAESEPAPTNVLAQSNSLSAAIHQFVADEQDPEAVSKIYTKVTEILTREEAIEYIAVQKKPVVTFSPDAVVVTNRRFLIYRPGIMGVTFVDYAWREVLNVHMSEQLLGATISCQTTSGRTAEVNHLPKRQARRIYSYAQEIEEWMVTKRRENELERLRASAGEVVVQTATAIPVAANSQSALPPQQEDPVAILKKLKAMLDGGLIHQGEYDAKKTEVLGRM